MVLRLEHNRKKYFGLRVGCMNFNKQKSVKYHKKTAASIMFRNLETELNSLTLTSVLEIRLGVDLNRED